MNYKTFRIFDIFLLSLLAITTEFLGYYLVGKLQTPFYLSFSTVITIIAMIRWGYIGSIVYIVSGICLLFTKGNISIYTIFYEVIANGFICLPFVFVKDTNISITKILKLILLCYITLSLGKGITMIIFDKVWLGFYYYITSNLLIIILNITILLILIKNKSQLVISFRRKI